MKKWMVLSILLYTQCVHGIPAQVILVRDAEKDNTGYLSVRGLERAGALASFLTMHEDLLSEGLPAAIFAARPTPNFPPYQNDDQSNRCSPDRRTYCSIIKTSSAPGYGRFEEIDLAQTVFTILIMKGKMS